MSEELKERLDIIERKIDMLIECISGNILPNCNKMNNHIDFIDRTYEKIRSPLNYICSMVKGVDSNDMNMLEYKKKELEDDNNMFYEE